MDSWIKKEPRRPLLDDGTRRLGVRALGVGGAAAGGFGADLTHAVFFARWPLKGPPGVDVIEVPNVVNLEHEPWGTPRPYGDHVVVVFDVHRARQLRATLSGHTRIAVNGIPLGSFAHADGSCWTVGECGVVLRKEFAHEIHGCGVVQQHVPVHRHPLVQDAHLELEHRNISVAVDIRSEENSGEFSAVVGCLVVAATIRCWRCHRDLCDSAHRLVARVTACEGSRRRRRIGRWRNREGYARCQGADHHQTPNEKN